MTPLKSESGEHILFSLRNLYKTHGYSQYKMNKFEEYDLYARNKDFLVSDRVIAFTDGNGKLLALKPDVTLSIVKNSKDSDTPQRLYYTENVYRVAKGNHNFKEIMQVGLECMGRIDDYCIYEVLHLAAESLLAISPANVLCVSHLGVISELLDALSVPESSKPEVFRLIGEKNAHELNALLCTLGVDENGIGLLSSLVSVKGKAFDVLPGLVTLLKGKVSPETLSGFVGVLSAFEPENAPVVDFSTVDDIHYYNGFAFKGFVEGIAVPVLSGGQYDKLMKKMGRSSGAIGFAVYFDEIEQLSHQRPQFDVDTFVLYDGTTALPELTAITKSIAADGKSFAAGTGIPADLRYRTLITIKNGKAVEHA